MAEQPELPQAPRPPQLPFPTRPRRLAGWLLKALGWRHDFVAPPEARVLVVVYPHTSNWDFMWGILSRWSAGWPISWVAKHSLFFWPTGRLLKSWGGIPVNRSAAEGFAENLAATIRARPHMVLAITPEGTRSYRDHWKSGFYRIAMAADVPVGIGYVDYATRTVGVAEYFRLSGDEEADMARIARAYQSKVARNPALAAPIRLTGSGQRKP
jgi:1-acyl-sn-glycerol-3-phosphate acyltransferase